MKRPFVAVLVCAGCLDFERPTRDYCINHPDLCLQDGGANAGGASGGSAGGAAGGRAGGGAGGRAGGAAGGTAGGSAGGSGGGSAGGAAVDAGFECAPYDGGLVDETASASFNVHFAEDGGPFRVKVGNNVGWTGIDMNHPLRQLCGPVRFLVPDWTNTNLYMQFPMAGRFGFYCPNHGDRHQLFEAVP